MKSRPRDVRIQHYINVTICIIYMYICISRARTRKKETERGRERERESERANTNNKQMFCHSCCGYASPRIKLVPRSCSRRTRWQIAFRCRGSLLLPP